MHPSAYQALVAPESVAILGASDNPLRPPGRIQRYLLDRYGFEGKVYPVNPRRDVVQGIKAYASLQQIDGPVDLAVIQSPAESVPDYIAECIEHGVKTALIVSSGFAEAGPEGEALDRKVRDLLREGTTRVVGPNSVGIVSVRSNLAASIQTGLDQERFDLTDGSVGFLTQSGAMGAFTLNKSQGRGIGLSTVVSTGNEMDVSYTEMLAAMVEDPLIDGIVGYIEGVSDGAGLIEGLRRARELGKPVGLMKVGRSERGSAAVASHTGALSGVNAVYQGVFDQFGVQPLTSIDELTDFTQMVNAGRRASGHRVTILTTSGGAGALSADYCEELGLELADWSDTWRERMAAVLPDFAGLGNPIDMTGAGGRPEVLTEVLELASQHPDTDMILLMLGNLERNEDALIDLIRESVATIDKPIALTWVGGTGKPLMELPRHGIPCFADPLPALRMLSWTRAALPVETPPASAPLSQGASAIVARARAAGQLQLDESDSKKLLAGYGIPVTAERRAAGPEEAAAAAQELGFPVVLKVLSHDIAHKTEIGGVELNLTSVEEVVAAGHRILGNVARHAAEVKAELLVQQMVPPGLEILLGVTNDDVFGPVVMVGMGGVMAELLDDTALRVPPISRELALESLRKLKGSPLFGGFRNSAPLDIELLATVVQQVSALAWDLREDIAELDINPFVLHASGSPSVAVDAVVILRRNEAVEDGQ